MNRDSSSETGRHAGAPRRWPAFVDAPTVLIVAVWVGIWLLWPSNGSGRQRSRVPAPGRVGYLAGGPAAPWYVEPDWFARTTRPGFGMPDVTAAMDSAVPDRSATEKPHFVQGGVGVDRPLDSAMPPTETNAEVRVRWDAKTTFSAAAPPPVVVTMSPELTARGFTLPPYTNDVPSVPERQWQVVAHVDVGADGRTENVLIEFGCEDPRVNATIARWLHRGTAGQSGAPVSGRVTVGGAGLRR